MELSIDARAAVAWLQTDPQATATIKDSGQLENALALAQGTGEQQADLLWHAQRTLAAGADDLLDLTALSRSVLGATGSVQFAKVKLLLVRNLAGSSGQVLQAGPGGVANGWTEPFAAEANALVQIGPGGHWMQAAPLDGWNVTSSSKILKVHNPGTTQLDYQIVLVGTSI